MWVGVQVWVCVCVCGYVFAILGTTQGKVLQHILWVGGCVWGGVILGTVIIAPHPGKPKV